jgi:hypothetical protein
MSAYDKDASMFTSRRRASGKTLKFSLSTHAKRAFRVRRCRSATAHVWLRPFVAPNAIANRSDDRPLSYSCKALFHQPQHGGSPLCEGRSRGAMI